MAFLRYHCKRCALGLSITAAIEVAVITTSPVALSLIDGHCVLYTGVFQRWSDVKGNAKSFTITRHLELDPTASAAF